MLVDFDVAIWINLNWVNYFCYWGIVYEMLEELRKVMEDYNIVLGLLLGVVDVLS